MFHDLTGTRFSPESQGRNSENEIPFDGVTWVGRVKNSYGRTDGHVSGTVLPPAPRPP